MHRAPTSKDTSNKRSTMTTLNEMDHLRESESGRACWPRHGLKLLYWFADDCIEFDSNGDMVARCDPTNNDFGFKRFKNRVNHDRNERLLPDENLPYYQVGNLNSPGAAELPEYVTEDHMQGDSNIDRIIASLDASMPRCFDRVYVTELDDQAKFDHDRTYRISKGLLKIIKKMELEDFLQQAGYQEATRPKLETLNEMSHLRESKFGQSWPRHGLKLLYWFANDCFAFDTDGDMVAQCVPSARDYGFHPFENRVDGDGDQLLPEQNQLYYEVGNLNFPGAKKKKKLPRYVTEDHTDSHHDDSNKDRLLVSLHDGGWFDRVYVTEHDGQANFDHDRTYRISRGLLRIIQNLELEDFLSQAGYEEVDPDSLARMLAQAL